MNESKGKSMTFQEYSSKVEELQLSEGWIITEKFEHLGSTFHIFNINRKELLANIEQFKNQNRYFFGMSAIKKRWIFS
jgi:hypothetical protein